MTCALCRGRGWAVWGSSEDDETAVIAVCFECSGTGAAAVMEVDASPLGESEE
jgi:hypothetical protein